MTTEKLFNQEKIEQIYDDIVINEIRELILKIFLGNKALTRNEIIKTLEAYYLKKYGEKKKYARTTVYDNMFALLQKGVIRKYQVPNPLGRGRPMVKWEIDDINTAEALLKESRKRNS